MSNPELLAAYGVAGSVIAVIMPTALRIIRVRALHRQGSTERKSRGEDLLAAPRPDPALRRKPFEVKRFRPESAHLMSWRARAGGRAPEFSSAVDPVQHARHVGQPFRLGIEAPLLPRVAWPKPRRPARPTRPAGSSAPPGAVPR